MYGEWSRGGSKIFVDYKWFFYCVIVWIKVWRFCVCGIDVYLVFVSGVFYRYDVFDCYGVCVVC